MKSILAKLAAIAEATIVAITSFFTGQPAPTPSALPEPPAIVAPAATPVTAISSIATVSLEPVLTPAAEPSVSPTPSPTPAPTVPPQFEEIIVQLEEVKREIAEYERLAPTPTPLPVATPTPTPTPSYRPVPVSVDEFLTDARLFAPAAMQSIDSCASKYPLSVAFYAQRKLDAMLGQPITQVGREAADAENLGNQSDAEHVALWDEYWNCVDDTLSVSAIFPWFIYGRKADDVTLAEFQQFLVEYVKTAR